MSEQIEPSLESASAPSQTVTRAPHAHRIGAGMFKMVVILIAITALGRIIWTLKHNSIPSGAQSLTWWAEIVLPAAMLGLVCIIAARHEIQWKHAVRRLRNVLPLVQASERPIEELASVGG